MKKRINSPSIVNKKILEGRVVGKGQRPDSIPVHEVNIAGKKGVVRKRRFVEDYNSFEKYMIFNNPKLAGQKNKIKEIYSNYKKTMVSNAIDSQLAWRSFFNAGLPVPKFSKIDLRRRKEFLATYMENLELRHGKLVDCHLRGKPVELKKLKVNLNSGLLRDLGGDLANIYNLGFYPKLIDFWHFYGEGRKKGRVILDFDSFRKVKSREEFKEFSLSSILTIKEFLGKKEFDIFLDSFLKRLSNKRVEDLKILKLKK